MTDDRIAPRLDLGALDAAPDDRRSDAVIAAVMSRIAAEPRARADDVAWLLRAQRRLLALAAALALIATGAILGAPRRPTTTPADLIAEWAQSSYVPTNAELLATFHEYRP